MASTAEWGDGRAWARTVRSLQSNAGSEAWRDDDHAARRAQLAAETGSDADAGAGAGAGAGALSSPVPRSEPSQQPQLPPPPSQLPSQLRGWTQPQPPSQLRGWTQTQLSASAPAPPPPPAAAAPLAAAARLDAQSSEPICETYLAARARVAALVRAGRVECLGARAESVAPTQAR